MNVVAIQKTPVITKHITTNLKEEEIKIVRRKITDEHIAVPYTANIPDYKLIHSLAKRRKHFGGYAGL
jgi:hypothetical protein